MISWFARNHVAANLLLITVLFLGFFSVKTQLPVEFFPQFDTKLVTVSVALRGATPEDVEQSIAIRIEEAVLDLEGIDRVISRSVEGSTQVNIELEDGYDERELLADIKGRVDAINTFPVDAEKPVVSLQQIRREVITVTVASRFGEQEVREYAEKVRDDLLRIPGISQVELGAVRNYEVGIEIPQDRLREFDLTLADVGAAIGNSSLDLSAGNLRTQAGDVLLRSKGQAYQRDEFERIVIKTNADGSLLRLGDIARVDDGFEEVPLRTRFNGEPAALVEVYQIGKESIIDIAGKVHEYIDDQQKLLPEGFHISYWDDDSQPVKNRIGTLLRNAAQGGILVLLLLTLFLRPAIAFWVFIGVPVSFMGAFFAMGLMGVSINIVSLFGFILVLGIVVDDAIVTGENVYRHMRGAESGLEAAINGTKEVSVPVTFGVLTTMAAFLPIAFIEGQRGAIFAQITLVVIPVLVFSLIESKLVLPAHLKHVRLKKNGHSNRLEQWQQRFAEDFERVVLRYYRPLLKLSLRHSVSVLALFIGGFILLLSMVTSGWTKFTFFPRVPSETVRATLTMPVGTAFEVTDRFVNRMVDSAETLRDKYRDPETGESVILNVLGTTGEAGGVGSTGQVRFEIVPPEQRDDSVTTADLVNEWRQRIGTIPGAESLLFRAELGRGGDPIDIQLSGRSLQQLDQVVTQVRQRLATYQGVFDINDNLSSGKEELQLELTAQGHALGLTRADVTRQVREAFFGVEVQRVQRGRDDVRVMVRLPLEERKALAELEGLLITTPTGGAVPLSHVASFKTGRSPATIYRIDHYRTVNVRADIDKETVNMAVLQQDLKGFLNELVQRFPGVRYELEGEAKEQSEAFGSLGWGLIFVLFVIYSLLAIPFRSYSQPLIVMSVMPFAAIGAMIGHWIMGMNLTIMSILGLLALLGVVVNDSLVLVDFINQRRRSNVGLLKAILKAGSVRFRPVMLTSATTFIGLMPLLFEKSTQAQFLIPMAVSLGFGILFATLITLIMVPINYLLLAKLNARMKG